MKVVEFKQSQNERTYGYTAKRGNRTVYVRNAVADRPSGPSRVFVSVKNENMLDDFGNRTSRPYNAWRPFVEDALNKAGITFEKLRWSQKAGCSKCPCSPGFIIVGENGKDYWVTIDAGVEPQRTDDFEALDRQVQIAGVDAVVENEKQWLSEDAIDRTMAVLFS